MTCYDNEPEAWHDVDGGLVEDAEERSTEEAHGGVEHPKHREQSAQLPRFHQLRQGRAGRREDVEVQQVEQGPDEVQGPHLKIRDM